MSTTTTTPTFTRPYIGSRHHRSYIRNSLISPSSSIFIDRSTTKERLEQSTTESTDSQETQEKYLSLDEKKTKELLSTSTSLTQPTVSTSSLFFFPTAQNTTTTTGISQSNCTPPSSSSSSLLLKEQQNISHHNEDEPFCQPFNDEKKNNQLLLEEEEKQKSSQSSNNFLSIRHDPNFDLSDVAEENNSFLSSYSLSDTIAENHGPFFTSTPILSSFPSQNPPTNNKIFLDQSSTISTVGLINELDNNADVCQLNKMSSFRYSTMLPSGNVVTHPYDQRISDQGNQYIIQLKTDEYQENEFLITPRYSTNQLIIDAKHREEDSAGGFVHRELHKIFNIPQHIDLNRFIYSYNKHNQELTIEMPYLAGNLSSIRNKTNSSTNLTSRNESNNTSGIGTTATDSTLMRTFPTAVATTSSRPFDFDLFHRSAFRPEIVRTTTNADSSEKKLLMSLDLSDYQPEEIKVSIKDRDLIVQAERKIETDKRKSRTSFFQSTNLPPQTDVEHLRSNFVDGKLIIEAPYLEQKSLTNNFHPTNQWRTVLDRKQQTISENPFQRRVETEREITRRRPR